MTRTPSSNASPDIPACGLDALGDVGGGKSAMRVEDLRDRRADGLPRLGRLACLRLAPELRSGSRFWLWLPFCLRPWFLFLTLAPTPCWWRRNLIESQDLALGDAKIGDLRLQISDFRVDAFEVWPAKKFGMIYFGQSRA
jgi:hypothetical protein